MKTSVRLVLFCGLFLIPAIGHASSPKSAPAKTNPLTTIGGCVDSPECPTAVLGLVGAATAALYARFRK